MCHCRGTFGKSAKPWLSGGLINPSQEVVEKMLAKLPQNPTPPLPSDPAPPSPEIPEAMVLKAVRLFPTGSAPGPSDLRDTHVKEVILCPSYTSASKALQSVSAYVNHLGAGHSPQEVTPHLCGASFLASPKKGGCSPYRGWPSALPSNIKVPFLECTMESGFHKWEIFVLKCFV